MALLDLIAQGGRGNSSPITKFFQGQQVKSQRELAALQNTSTRQDIKLNRLKEQESRIKLIAPLVQEVQSIKDPAQRELAYQKNLGFLTGRGVDVGQVPNTFAELESSGVAGTILKMAGIEDKPLFTTPASKDFTPESKKTFSVTKDQSDLVPIKRTGDVTNINLKGDSALTKAIGKQAGKQIVENKNLAVKAGDSIRNANEAIKILNSGVITGFGAEFIANLGRAVTQLGFDTGDLISNTQAFAANQGKSVLDILGSGALGAGTGISDNDRLFAKQIAGGDISLEESSIRRIIELNAKVSTNAINRHNKEFEAIRSKSPIDLSVELPDFINPKNEDFGDLDKSQQDRLKELRSIQGG